ncbi:DUF1850 domain-containing protein [Halomonas cerina]|uniref:DUF1850 domain-containing protein n=1 Tax=Halomonas cerina TaxID=447424 RepID=A0A839V4B9_9GAMM|nr:DUF1850 domain-containing protein [Halomonas cerina]MBB3190533.1 hypothetical protein [Halomonas cerina]
MSSSRLTSGRALLPALLSCLALVPAMAGAATHLEVLADDGEVLVRQPMPEGEGWCLAWNHSVAGFPVLDCYRHRRGHMVLVRSHQPDFAAGLGHVPGRGRQTSDGRGGYWIEDIDEPVPGDRYRLRVGSLEVDHRLVTATRKVSLSRLAAHEPVTIRLHDEPAVASP